jgi:hypothetical protein
LTDEYDCGIDDEIDEPTPAISTSIDDDYKPAGVEDVEDVEDESTSKEPSF